MGMSFIQSSSTWLVGALQDVSAGDNEARTPLHYAAGYNHAEIAMMLLEAGANLEARDTKVRCSKLHCSQYMQRCAVAVASFVAPLVRCTEGGLMTA
jgi:ankyrin repeat protein